MYFIQECYKSGYLASEGSEEDETKAINQAKALLKAPYFIGDYVRVLSYGGEIVWTSQETES